MQNKWMTKGEFEGKHAGFCWIVDDELCVGMAFYDQGVYYESPISYLQHDASLIKAVMPIEKPEYSKEVG